jgi:Leucine-rich repeat (LRR) protein
VVNLSQNGFTDELGGGDVLPLNASRVRILDVSFNSLSSLHAGVFLGHPRLRSFSAESNLLAGKVPGSLSSCTEVQYLNMANNSLHGTLDLFNFARLTRLRALHIGWNHLTGHIPASLSSCRDLRVVNLRRNNLTSAVPSSLRRLQTLAFFASATTE